MGTLEEKVAIGVIEVYYMAGMRSIPVLAGEDMLRAAMEGHDIWEENDERVRVRVVRFLGDGEQMCICHLPPSE